MPKRPGELEGTQTDVSGVVPEVISDETTARHGAVQRLVCVAGPDLGRTIRITSPTVTIGRGAVDIALKATDVSRTHARIVLRDHDAVIDDLGSANGTYVNGVRVRGRAPLRVGDRIQIGGTILVFTHHDELEDRMHQLQRLEALAQLAGGLAHDFSNALAVILANLQLLEKRHASDPDSVEMLADMKGAATAAHGLARRLLRLGRPADPVELEPVALAPLVTKTVTMMRRQLPPEITVSVDVPSDLVVRGSQEELHQVLLNLMLNARDAMPDGGALRITARAVSFDRGQAATRQLPTKGDYVELVVRDTGIGMDEATQARAFEPFFTTKPPGQGTGLGLAMIHAIIGRHGGAIVVESAPGAGATFTIWLPIS